MSGSPASSPKIGAKGKGGSMKRPTSGSRDDTETQPLLSEIVTTPPPPHVAITVADSSPRAASCASHDGHEPRKCRICLEEEEGSPKGTPKAEDTDNPLISPCLCSGSTKWIHRKCLEEWRNQGHRADAFYRCEICKYEYRFERVLWARILGSAWTVTSIFLVVMTVSCLLLGFVPILSLKQIEAETHLNWWLLHIANGAINLGMLGLVVGLVLACLGMCNRLPGGSGFFYFPSCPLVCDCTALDIAACGEAGLVCVVVLLIIGFILASYVVYVLLYTLIQTCLKNVERMVENVSA